MAMANDNSTTLQLQDIHVPPSPGVWPLAAGWWILIALAAFIAIWFVRKIVKKAKQKKSQRIVLSELKNLQNKLKESPSNKILADINILLRRVAISAYSREKIASLTGAEWLQLLDRSVKNSGFSKGAGRILVDAPYQLDEVSNLNLAEFTPLIRTSVKNMLKGKLSKNRGGVS